MDQRRILAIGAHAGDGDHLRRCFDARSPQGHRGTHLAPQSRRAGTFSPYIYVDATAFRDAWRDAVQTYELFRGGVSSFDYVGYYDALACPVNKA